MADASGSTADRVARLLNDASLLSGEAKRVEALRRVKELIINKEPVLLDSFVEDVLQFQTDRSGEVKSFVVSFVVDACKMDGGLLPRVVSSLTMLLMDSNSVSVQKRVIFSMQCILRTAMSWLCKERSVTDTMEPTWQCICDIKDSIMDMIDSKNGGIRDNVIKCMEGLVISFTRRGGSFEEFGSAEDYMCVDDVPAGHPLLKPNRLLDEGRRIFEQLLELVTSRTVTSQNLMTCFRSLVNIARLRPQYTTRIVAAFESVHGNMPTAYELSQVSSVRKAMRTSLLLLLRLPTSRDHHQNITTLLTDLGARPEEVTKNMGKADEKALVRKRRLEQLEATGGTGSVFGAHGSIKRLRADEGGDEPFIPGGATSVAMVESNVAASKTAIEMTSDDLVPRLSISNVADLVMVNMVRPSLLIAHFFQLLLPEEMPVQFASTYTPIAAAGTGQQIQHMARLLSAQLVGAGIGVGSSAASARRRDDEMMDATDYPAPDGTTRGELPHASAPFPSGAPGPPTPSHRRRTDHFRLADVTHRIAPDVSTGMQLAALKRIIEGESKAEFYGGLDDHFNVLASLVTLNGSEQFRAVLRAHIMEQTHRRQNLALAWLYREYAAARCFTAASPIPAKGVDPLVSYDQVLTSLLVELLTDTSPVHGGIFPHIILNAPHLTENALGVLQTYCLMEHNTHFGFTALGMLITNRPQHRKTYLEILLNFTAHANPDIHKVAISHVKSLHENHLLAPSIEKHALRKLGLLCRPKAPVQLLYGAHSGRARPIGADGKVDEAAMETWTEDAIRPCLNLIGELIPIKPQLLLKCGPVFADATSEVRRVLNRFVEKPVRSIPASGLPHIFEFLKSCPPSAESLIARVAHTVAENTQALPELVPIMKDLYEHRTRDVRLLIPVLHGLTKNEILEVLPELIKVNPILLKDVFTKLKVNIPHGSDTVPSGGNQPISPAALLVALHRIDISRTDLKTIIRAMNMLVSEVRVYRQDVILAVIQQLLGANQEGAALEPLPPLFMRTVLYSLASYPLLVDYVISQVLPKLIERQVWTHKLLWEGWVKCAQKLLPRSLKVLLGLPAAQLRSSFALMPEMRTQIRNHLANITPQQFEADGITHRNRAEITGQKAMIPRSVIAVLEEVEPVVAVPVVVSLDDDPMTGGQTQAQLPHAFANQPPTALVPALPGSQAHPIGQPTPTIAQPPVNVPDSTTARLSALTEPELKAIMKAVQGSVPTPGPAAPLSTAPVVPVATLPQSTVDAPAKPTKEKKKKAKAAKRKSRSPRSPSPKKRSPSSRARSRSRSKSPAPAPRRRKRSPKRSSRSRSRSSTRSRNRSHSPRGGRRRSSRSRSRSRSRSISPHRRRRRSSSRHRSRSRSSSLSRSRDRSRRRKR